jgi:hypothetical protein
VQKPPRATAKRDAIPEASEHDYIADFKHMRCMGVEIAQLNSVDPAIPKSRTGRAFLPAGGILNELGSIRQSGRGDARYFPKPDSNAASEPLAALEDYAEKWRAVRRTTRLTRELERLGHSVADWLGGLVDDLLGERREFLQLCRRELELLALMRQHYLRYALLRAPRLVVSLMSHLSPVCWNRHTASRPGRGASGEGPSDNLFALSRAFFPQGA